MVMNNRSPSAAPLLFHMIIMGCLLLLMMPYSPPRPIGSWKQSAVLDASHPAAAICLAARSLRGDLPFLTSQPPGKLLLLDGNGT